MYKDLKYALDFLFIFMLVLSIIIYAMGLMININGPVVSTLHTIDFVVLGGYYGFFVYGVSKAKQKLSYIKKHWILLTLLLVPFLPVARLMRLVELERIFAISTNTLWHFLDELGLL